MLQPASFYQNLLVRVVVVLAITTIRQTFAAVTTYYRNHQVQRVVGPLITIHLNTHAADIMFTQNHSALIAAHFGAYTVTQATMEFQ